MNWRTLSLAALGGIIVGIVVQIIGGNDNFPTIPPGIVFAVLAIATVLITRPWWLVNFAWFMPTMLLIGGFVSDPGLLPLLTEPDNATIRIGALIVLVAYLVASRRGQCLCSTAGGAGTQQRRIADVPDQTEAAIPNLQEFLADLADYADWRRFLQENSEKIRFNPSDPPNLLAKFGIAEIEEITC